MKNITGENANNQQPINCQSSTNHKHLEAKTSLVIPEQDLNFPARGIMFQKLFVRLCRIGTQITP